MNQRTWPALDVGRLTRTSAHDPDLLQAALVDYSITAINETTPDLWQVFFSSDAERDGAAKCLASEFPHLSVRPLDVPDENWVARSQASLRAVRVGDIVVAPPWDVPGPGTRDLDGSTNQGATPRDQPLVIVIRPSMGFGTAHHATTRRCLATLQHLDVHGRSVIDVGTGSGVLAIAASRLGAAAVVGIDDDADALQAAEDNLSLNPGTTVTLRAADLRSTDGETFDIVMANLTAALLIGSSGRLRDLAAPGARLILSGFQHDEEAAILAAYSDFALRNRSEEEGWVCIDVQRP